MGVTTQNKAMVLLFNNKPYINCWAASLSLTKRYKNLWKTIFIASLSFSKFFTDCNQLLITVKLLLCYSVNMFVILLKKTRWCQRKIK